jgi:hypothetical protein
MPRRTSFLALSAIFLLLAVSSQHFSPLSAQGQEDGLDGQAAAYLAQAAELRDFVAASGQAYGFPPGGPLTLYRIVVPPRASHDHLALDWVAKDRNFTYVQFTVTGSAPDSLEGYLSPPGADGSFYIPLPDGSRAGVLFCRWLGQGDGLEISLTPGQKISGQLVLPRVEENRLDITEGSGNDLFWQFLGLEISPLATEPGGSLDFETNGEYLAT